MPNKTTAAVREVIARFAEENAERFGEWISRTAEKDPARAADLYLRALEYHIPKIQRSELVADGMKEIKFTLKCSP